MIIKIGKEDLRVFVNTIYMGVHMANTNRKNSLRLSQYDKIMDDIFSCYLKETKKSMDKIMVTTN